jgi:hypothetical protein
VAKLVGDNVSRDVEQQLPAHCAHRRTQQQTPRRYLRGGRNAEQREEEAEAENRADRETGEPRGHAA